VHVVVTTEHGGPSAVPALRGRHPLLRQLGRYVVAGGVGTAVNALVYLALRTGWDDALGANLVSLLVSTLVSTEVNRRFTFENAGGHPWRAHVQTAGMVAFYAVYSSAASVLGGAARFLLLRFWVFRGDEDGAAGAAGADGAGGVSGADDTVARAVRRWRERHRWAVRVVLAASAGVALLLAAACVPLGY
jgi:putative flippase GtrA